jgi:hypothetical protein
MHDYRLLVCDVVLLTEVYHVTENSVAHTMRYFH